MQLNDLSWLAEDSRSRGIPILSPEKAELLFARVQSLRPKFILELGTANGYSGCILGSAGGKVVTIEQDRKIADEAWETFQKQKVNAQVMVGDAVKEVRAFAEDPDHEGYFHLIFLDFSKRRYLEVLEDCVKLCAPGGIIVADNVFMEKCADFLSLVQNHPQLETETLAIGDGLSWSRKR